MHPLLGPNAPVQICLLATYTGIDPNMAGVKHIQICLLAKYRIIGQSVAQIQHRYSMTDLLACNLQGYRPKCGRDTAHYRRLHSSLHTVGEVQAGRPQSVCGQEEQLHAAQCCQQAVRCISHSHCCGIDALQSLSPLLPLLKCCTLGWPG